MQDSEILHLPHSAAYVCHNSYLNEWRFIKNISKMQGRRKLSTTIVYAKVMQFEVGLDMEIRENKLAKM